MDTLWCPRWQVRGWTGLGGGTHSWQPLGTQQPHAHICAHIQHQLLKVQSPEGIVFGEANK